MKTLTEFSSVFIKNAYKVRGEFINTRRVELQKEALEKAELAKQEALAAAQAAAETATETATEAAPVVADATAAEVAPSETTQASPESAAAEAPTATESVAVAAPVLGQVPPPVFELGASVEVKSEGAEKRTIEKVTKITVDPSLLLKPGERHAAPEDPRQKPKGPKSNEKSRHQGKGKPEPRAPQAPRIMVPDEEIEKHLGETLKLEGDKLTHIKNALSVIDPKRAEDLKRVIVLAAAEVKADEKPGVPKTSAEKIGEFYYLAEYMPSLRKPAPDRSARADSRDGGRGGKRGDRGGRGDKGGKRGREDKRGGPGGGGRGPGGDRGGPGGDRGARNDRGAGGGGGFGARKPRSDSMPAKSGA